MSMDILIREADFFRSPIADTEASPELVLQQLEAVLKIARGEWLMNIREGFPWQVHSINKRFSTEAFKRDIFDAVEEIPELSTPVATVRKEARVVTARIESRYAPTGEVLSAQIVFDPQGQDVGDGIVAAFVPSRRAR